MDGVLQLSSSAPLVFSTARLTLYTCELLVIFLNKGARSATRPFKLTRLPLGTRISTGSTERP
jgi:hypothetical protein